MLNSKLVEVLNSFSRKEMTRFCDFAHSPYFNKHGDVQHLLEYLSAIFPHFEEENCHRETLINQLFSTRKNAAQHLTLVFTYTQRLVEQFMIQEQFKAIDGFHNVLLLRNLRQRKLPKYYEKIERTQNKLLSQKPLKDADYYNLKFLTAAESDAYHSQLARLEKDQSIQLKQDNFDHYYLSEKLKDACEMQNRGSILKVNYSNHLQKILIEVVRNNLTIYQDAPPIMIYFHLYEMITMETEAYYFRALKIIEEYEHFISQSEKQNVYNFLQNHCIKGINKGDQKYYRLLLELYQKQLAKGLLLDDEGYLVEWNYKNIVTNGIRLKEMEWTKSFIESYRSKLRPSVVENAYTFNLAAFYYSANELEKVQELLIQVEYTDIRYSLAAKSLLMRTYYDLNEYDALLSLIRSFRQYLYRNKLIEEKRRSAFINLLKFTQKSFQIKSRLAYQSKQKTSQAIQQLKDKISNTEFLINEVWLHQKLAELGT